VDVVPSLRSFNHPLQKAIVSFNNRSKNFDTLHRFFSKHIDKDTAERYMTTVVPAMARLALRLPELITQVRHIVQNISFMECGRFWQSYNNRQKSWYFQPLPLLRQGKLSSVTMSQEQAACILANAFFCTFPGRNTSSPILPSINFNS
jgi:poly(ADP-ribose) glycohydrolase